MTVALQSQNDLEFMIVVLATPMSRSGVGLSLGWTRLGCFTRPGPSDKELNHGPDVSYCNLCHFSSNFGYSWFGKKS
jgi:hypothetical protein